MLWISRDFSTQKKAMGSKNQRKLAQKATNLKGKDYKQIQYKINQHLRREAGRVKINQ